MLPQPPSGRVGRIPSSRGICGCAGMGALEMKGKPQRLHLGHVSVSSNEQVRAEIESFLHALASYPEQFAQKPGISFEQYRSSLIRRELKQCERN
jgi:hypothetical protein